MGWNHQPVIFFCLMALEPTSIKCLTVFQERGNGRPRPMIHGKCQRNLYWTSEDVISYSSVISACDKGVAWLKMPGKIGPKKKWKHHQLSIVSCNLLVNQQNKQITVYIYRYDVKVMVFHTFAKWSFHQLIKNKTPSSPWSTIFKTPLGLGLWSQRNGASNYSCLGEKTGDVTKSVMFSYIYIHIDWIYTAGLKLRMGFWKTRFFFSGLIFLAGSTPPRIMLMKLCQSISKACQNPVNMHKKWT